MLPLHPLSHMPCHDHLASDMHCFGCCPFSPCDVYNIAHEETPIVSSYILGDFDSSHPLHDPHTCMLNLHPHRVIHNNYSFMMDDMFLYHASNFFERCLSCANSHVHIHIMMDDVYIYHAHNFFGLCLFCVGTHEYLSTSQSHELTKRALESNDALGSHGLSFPPLSSLKDFTHFFYMALRSVVHHPATNSLVTLLARLIVMCITERAQRYLSDNRRDKS